MKGDHLDPKALIDESYKIEGITLGECKTIFLDWALSMPEGTDVPAVLNQLIARHGVPAPDHPMTQVMTEGLEVFAGPPRRRGGWRSRPRPEFDS